MFLHSSYVFTLNFVFKTLNLIKYTLSSSLYEEKLIVSGLGDFFKKNSLYWIFTDNKWSNFPQSTMDWDYNWCIQHPINRWKMTIFFFTIKT